MLFVNFFKALNSSLTLYDFEKNKNTQPLALWVSDNSGANIGL